MSLATVAPACAIDEDVEEGASASPPPTAPAASAAPARYLVAFKDGKGAAGRSALRAAGASVALDLAAHNAVAARIPASALAGLRANPSVDFIEEDAVREPTALWNDAASGGETMPYGIQMVQADKIQSPGAGSRKVCIIDSGYSQQHVDLRQQGDGVTFVNTAGTGNWDLDSCGHGTHVAGTVSAIEGNGTGVVGVSPGVSLHIVKVFGNDDLASGSCQWTYASNLVAALDQCVAAGANVVNMSLGGGAKSRVEESAFKKAYAAGLLSIASAGNAGTKSTSYPAGYASVVSVAAVDANEQVAGFSQRNRDVELAAPGVAVLSSVPWLEDNSLSASGSSWSGLHVEGAARTAGATGALVDGGQCTAAGAWAGKVVLCQRGTITFVEKVNNVQAGGGTAAVIYNNVASDATCGDFGATLGDGVTSAIPAISLSCSNGASALSKAGAAGTVVSNVNLPDSGYEAWDGTSMAAPHVSGVAALVWSCHPTASNAQIRNALTGSAHDVGASGRDTSYGFGIVQARAALSLLGGDGACSSYP